MSSDETTRTAGTDTDPASDELRASTLQVSDGDGPAPLGEDADRGPGAPSDDGPARFASLRVLWLNAAALAAVLLMILVIMRPSSISAVDEGLYLAQTDALTEGSWSIPLQTADVDPEGILHPLLPEVVLGDRVIPYARHSTYPLLLTPLYWIGGYTGTLVLSILGTWGAAVSAAFISRRIKPQYTLWTLWLIGVGSPLLFDAYLTMAHSLIAAAAGVAFLGITRAVDDRRWIALSYGIPALVLTVLLRSEGVVFGIGLGVAIGVMALGPPRSKRLDPPAVALAVGVGIISAATYFVDTRLDHMITGVDGYGINAVRIATRSSADPITGSWASLFRPFGGSWVEAGISVPLGAMAVILAALSLRLVPRRTLLPLGFCIGAAAAAMGVLINQPGLVTGLFAALPVLVAGLIWLNRSDMNQPLVPRALMTAGIAAAATIATIYAEGGATEWGGRFFHILLPILVPLTVLGLDNARQKLTRREAVLAVSCIAVFTLSMSVSALRWQAETRREIENFTDATIEYTSQVSEGRPPLVLLAGLDADGSARVFWDSPDDFELLPTAGIANLGPILMTVEAAGRSRVIIVSNVSPDELEFVLDGTLDRLGWRILDTADIETPVLVTVGDPETAD
jgi:hypothetical protein